MEIKKQMHFTQIGIVDKSPLFKQLVLFFSLIASSVVVSDSKAATASEKFDVRIVYEADVNTNSVFKNMSSGQRSKYTQAVRNLYSRLDIEGGYRAIPVVDSLYEKSHVPTEKSPYITLDLYQAIVDSGACDINAVGACLVVEKDVRSSVGKERAYYIASAPESPRSRLVRVARKNLDLQSTGLLPEAQLITEGLGNQILVFAQIGSQKESKELNEETYNNEQPAPEKPVSHQQMDTVVDEVISISSQAVQEQVSDLEGSFATRERALAGSCFIAADLKVMRRYIGILLPKSYIDEAGQRQYKPTKQGKGRIYCYLPDGTRQMPKVEVKVIDRFVSLGWRLSKGTEKFGATGIGWAVRGAQDIIAIGSFRYLVSIDSSISNFFWNHLPGLWKSIGFFIRGNLTPIIIGGKKGHGGVLAAAAGIGVHESIWSEASISLGGEITINYDPDDL